MDPEPIPDDLPARLQQEIVYDVVIHLRDLEKEEANAIRDLQHLQEQQQDIQDQLANIGYQREHWTRVLRAEAERLHRERISDLLLAETRANEENRRISAGIEAGLHLASEALPWDREHLVGRFVQLFAVDYTREQEKGVVTGRTSQVYYTVLCLSGIVLTLQQSQFFTSQSLCTERETLRSHGYDGPFL
jgi:hypothetical protein